MCHPPTCVYRVYIAACCVICLIGAVAVIAIGMALGYRMGEDSVYNFKENRPKGVAVTSENRRQMLEVQSHFKHITTSLTGSGIISGTISMIGGYGACCNLAMALYLFMVGVALLVIAEVGTGSLVYYKQTLIIETLSEFRENGICGTICFLDDLVSRQLMSAVIIVVGMTVLQIGQIICAYCIVRRLSTPKPVRNIQHAVRRMTAHLFSIHSTAVAMPSTSSGQRASDISPSNAPLVPFFPPLAMASEEKQPGTNNNDDENKETENKTEIEIKKENENDNENKIEEIGSRNSHGTDDENENKSAIFAAARQNSNPQVVEQPLAKAILVSEGAQTDDIEDVNRPLLSAYRQPPKEEVPHRRSTGTSPSIPFDDDADDDDREVVSIVQDSLSRQKNSRQHSSVIPPAKVSISNDLEMPEVASQVGRQHLKSAIKYSSSDARPLITDGFKPVSQPTRFSPPPVTSEDIMNGEQKEHITPSVVVYKSLSSSSHHQPNASHSTTIKLNPSSAASVRSRNPELTTAAATSFSPQYTHQLSLSARGSRATKLIPSSFQSPLPAPNIVKKLNDFRDISRPQLQHVNESQSPSSMRRQQTMPTATKNQVISGKQHYQRPSHLGTSKHFTQFSTPSDSLDDHFRTTATQIKFAALPPSIGAGNFSNTLPSARRARSYTSVDMVEGEAFEAADYIDLRELRRSPGTPGALARAGHLHHRKTVLCSHQQPPLFPSPAHPVGSYPDRNQWRLPEIRTLYVSYV